MGAELLYLVDRINNSDYAKGLSYFRPFATKIKFSFTLEDYVHSLQKYKTNRSIDHCLNIILHEHFHFFQRICTTVGFYSNLIEQFKIAIAINIATYIIQNSKRVPRINAPLINIIESDKALINDNYLTKLLFNWIDADLIYSYINDTYVNYNEKFELANNIRTDLPLVAKKFITLEKELFNYLQASSFIKGSNSYISNTTHPNDIRLQLKTEEINARNKILNIFPSINSILESYSKAAEFCLNHKAFHVSRLKSMPIPVSKHDYYFPLTFASNYIPTTDPLEFLLTYLAVCDLALSPPILPYLYEMRKGNPSIEEIDPCYRFYLALNHVTHIQPIRSLHEDYDRYIKELCDSLNWVTPKGIAEKTVATLQAVEGDLVSQMFCNSQKNRSVSPYFYFEIEPFLLFLSDNLSFCPIVEFTDDVFINHFLDKDLSFSETYFVLEYFKKQFWGSILTKIPSKLYFPYRTKSSVIDVYANMFCRMYGEMFNINLKNIQFINHRI